MQDRQRLAIRIGFGKGILQPCCRLPLKMFAKCHVLLGLFGPSDGKGFLRTRGYRVNPFDHFGRSRIDQPGRNSNDVPPAWRSGPADAIIVF